MFTLGNPNAPILVVVDPPSATAMNQQLPMNRDNFEYFAQVSNDLGFTQNDFAFMNACPYMDEVTFASKSRQGKYLKEHRDLFLQTFANFSPRIVLTLGGIAANQVAGRPIQITKARGHFIDYAGFARPTIHLLAVGAVLRSPQNAAVFQSDFRMIRQCADRNFSTQGMGQADDYGEGYRWCTDLTEWLENKPKSMSVDTEATGLEWIDPTIVPFTVQFCRRPGDAIMVPLLPDYYPELERDHTRLIQQVKLLVEDPTIAKIGHNIKFDYHMLRKLEITIENWRMDTMQAASAVNENIKNKSLDECVRLYVPDMSGYADEFNKTYDKSQMIAVPKDEILNYGCGDADATLRLAISLQSELVKDPKQWDLFRKIQMPALRAFADTLEVTGVPISEQKLADLVQVLERDEEAQYKKLIQMVPPKVKKKHLEVYKGKSGALSFSRSAFLIDVLFTSDGFGLKPKIFTKASGKPSVSAKDHLPYFKGHTFVDGLIEYQKLQKMRTTYVGVPADEKGLPTGFWKHIFDGKIHPSYFLHHTVTGRTSSANPNGQNLPKRGTYAKAYRKIFVAPEGWSFIQSDYSQAELRIAAWMANEPTMIQAYLDGKDLHLLTAMNLMGMSEAEFMALPEEERDDLRYRAKACNFGLLYRMSVGGYKEYAYIGYNVLLSLDDAERDVARHYDLYTGLRPWHNAQVEFAHQHGYVRALHGAKRTLPDLKSNDRGMVSMAERQAINSPVQRFASDLGVMSLLRVYRDLKAHSHIPLKPSMFIHDALVWLCRDDYIEEGLTAVKFFMESNPLRQWFNLESPIPLLSDLEVGKNLGQLAKRNDVLACAPNWYGGD